jgi:hypothetical protein
MPRPELAMPAIITCGSEYYGDTHVDVVAAAASASESR